MKHGKIALIQAKLRKLGISQGDFTEKFSLPGSRGGQKADKTSSLVTLKHMPTGISVKCGKTRERETNRWIARRLLAEKLEEKITGKSARADKIEKIKKQKKRRKRRNKNKSL